MGSGLRETHLHGEQREAVARCGRQQDASDIERVEDLSRRIPQARSGEEVDIKPGAVPDRLATV